jgi:hypothetical protein
MAVNEKVVYTNQWTSHGGRLFRPGEQLSGRVDPAVVRSAQEAGLTTSSHAEAERAKSAEAERQRDVARQIESRSEKRDSEKRVDKRA